MLDKLRNIAIIAHVDHGKTTLIDQLLRQSDTLDERTQLDERAMDSNALEKERGITITAKTTAIKWGDYRINIVDTPGHADFGGEVERILSMVDSVLLLVDAVDGPMPQTRFVTQKAFAQGLKPIVVINKVDRDGARPHWVMDQVFDLFDNLGASDEQLDFTTVYTSALNGFATLGTDQLSTNMIPLLQTIVDQVSPPDVDIDAPLQMQITSLDYSSYVGAIAIGRITQGTVHANMPVTVIDTQGKTRTARILQVFSHLGLQRIETQQAYAGDIIAITGINDIQISDTLCDPKQVQALPALTVDEPTMNMIFQVNDSPLAGRDGKFLTSRQLKDRLERELIHNVALRVEETDDPDKFRVAGRGELHLGILLETMRREGYELGVSRPEVIYKQIGDETHEPYEQLTVDILSEHQGTIMDALATRGGDLQNMVPDGKGRIRLDYIIPTRGLIGFQQTFMTSTSGSGLLHHIFDHYDLAKNITLASRHQGALIANCAGKATSFALFNLQARGRMLIAPQTEVYEGMIIGIHTRENDLVVNVTKEKALTNIRAAGSDENIILTPPIKLSLEQAIELINDDELVEITPQTIRLRKKFLKEHERKRTSKK